MGERERDDAIPNARRQYVELGALLRARRAALRPEHVGIPAGKRRHVPGLRREEVAQLAEVGLDWYAALEQGRITNISLKSLRRVISSLHLNAVESEHAFSLARDVAPAPAPTNRQTGPLEAFVRSYQDGAAFVIDGGSDAFAWNALADELFAFSSRPKGDRRMLAMMIREPRMRSVFVNWYETLEQMIGVFRRTFVANSGATLDELVNELRDESLEFDRLWRAYAVGSPTTHVCKLRGEHGKEMHFHFIAFSPIDHPEYTVVALQKRTPSHL